MATIGTLADTSKNVGTLPPLSHPAVVVQGAFTAHGCKDHIDVD